MGQKLKDRVRTLELRTEVLAMALQVVMDQLAEADPVRSRKALNTLVRVGGDAMPADEASAFAWLFEKLSGPVEHQVKTWRQALGRPAPAPRPPRD